MSTVQAADLIQRGLKQMMDAKQKPALTATLIVGLLAAHCDHEVFGRIQQQLTRTVDEAERDQAR